MSEHSAQPSEPENQEHSPSEPVEPDAPELEIEASEEAPEEAPEMAEPTPSASESLDSEPSEARAPEFLESVEPEVLKSVPSGESASDTPSPESIPDSDGSAGEGESVSSPDGATTRSTEDPIEASTEGPIGSEDASVDASEPESELSEPEAESSVDASEPEPVSAIAPEDVQGGSDEEDDDEFETIEGAAATTAEELSEEPETEETEESEPAEATPEAAAVASTQTPPTQQTAPGSTDQAAGGTAQQIWSRVQPVLKAGTVWSLQTSIRGLDWSEQKLAAPKADTPSDAAPPSDTTKSRPVEKVWAVVQPVLVATSLVIVRSLNSAFKWGLQRLDAEAMPSPAAVSAEPSAVESAASSFWSRLQPILQQLWRLWRRFLAILRDRVLPDSLKQLSDVTLTTLAVGILAVLLWITSALTSRGSPTPAAEVPANGSPVEVAPGGESPGTVPKASKPAASTPEQTLLASIQAQVSELTADYAEGLVQSVEADFQADLLTVTVGLDWYGLDEAQQNRLAKDLLKRSQDLDFEKLEVVDVVGDRVARSPVVGPTMIIFKRTADETIQAKLNERAAEIASPEPESEPELEPESESELSAEVLSPDSPDASVP